MEIRLKAMLNKKNNQITIVIPRRKLHINKNTVPEFFTIRPKKGGKFGIF